MAGSGKDLEVEKPWQKRERMLKHDAYRGSKLPPFSIEHMPSERERLSGMTDEDRRLRRQWLQDQKLSPNEPREIPGLKPKNIFKRIAAKPWDIFFNAVRPVVGSHASQIGRFYIPKMVLALTGVWATYYHFKYNRKTWERSGGWDMYGSKPPVYAFDGRSVQVRDEFVDRGFSKRESMKDLQTSYT